MIVILEGPDGAGKTTLGQYMAKSLNGAYLHLSYRWPDHMFEYHTAAIRYAIRLANKTKAPVIIDRWWPSESLYAAEFRGGSKWPHMGRMMDRIARKHAAMYVYCLPMDLVAYEKRFEKLRAERKEMYDSVYGVARRYLQLWYGDSNHISNENYTDMLVRTGGLQNRRDHINYSIETWGDRMGLFADYVVQRAAERLTDQLPNSMSNPNLLGHLEEAKYLMIGEQVNPKHHNLYWPWYDYGNSSLYLAEALQGVPAREELFMWANALNHDGTRNHMIKQVVDAKPEIKVIAVGKEELFTHLAKEGIEVFEYVKHPAFVKRFEGGVEHMREILRHAIH